jgi:TRAP-type mannitol/chloroaromatic compound transport system permease large subunit
MDEGMSHLILLAVPLFVFLGLLIEMTGMAKAMVGTASRMRWLIPSSMRPTTTMAGARVVSIR